MPPSSRSKSTAGLYQGGADITGGPNAEKSSNTMFAFGAEFVEVRVHARTRETRVPRIVGAFAAAVASAFFHATGRRVRELPITIDKLIAPDKA